MHRHQVRKDAGERGRLAGPGRAPSRAGKLDDLGPFDLVVTTYGLLQIDAGALAAVDWHSAVLRRGAGGEEPGGEARAGGAGAEGTLVRPVR